MANGTIDGLRARSKQITSLASLDGAGQFLAFAHFHKDKSPAIMENSFDLSRDIDHIFSWDDIVQAMDISIEHFIIPEAVAFFFIIVDVLNLRNMSNGTFST